MIQKITGTTDNQLAKGSLIGLVGHVAGYMCHYLFQVSVTRTLGSTSAGVFFAFNALISLLAIVARAGLDRTGLRTISVQNDRGDLGAVRKSAFTLSVFIAAFSFMLIIPMFFLRSQLSAFYGIEGETGATVLFILSVPGVAVSFALAEFLRGMKRLMRCTLVQLIITYSVAIIGIWVAFYVWGGKLALAAMAFLVGSWVSVAAGILLILVTTRSGVAAAQAAASELYGGALFMLVVSLLFFGMGGMDVLLLGYLLPGAPTAYYVAAMRTAMLTSIGLVGVNSITVPMVAALYKRGEKEDLEGLVVTGARWGLTMAALMAGFLMIGGPMVLQIFGSGFDKAYVLLLILLAGQLVNSGSGPVAFILLMTGNEKRAAYVLFPVNAVMVAGYILLIPLMGAAGAAVVTAGGIALWNLGMIRQIKVRVGIKCYADNLRWVTLFLALQGLVSLLCLANSAIIIPALVLYAFLSPLALWKYVLTPRDREMIGSLKTNIASCASLMHRFQSKQWTKS
jgi:O-antigen/teichoic acid export membrane protein